MNTPQTARPSRRPNHRMHALRPLFAPVAGAALSSLLCLQLAYAGPQGGVVTAGQASITQTPALTTINQSTQRAAINWSSFNVGARETVNFQQPGANAVTLNRVVGGGESAIFGQIKANGTILLINPDGIVFGRTAQIDVGGLLASTANIANADFMAGRLNFSEPGRPGATVRNEGRITIADGGLAALVAPGVANSGVIMARLGKVALAAGDAFVLDLHGDRLVQFAVDASALATLTDAHGAPLAARIDQSGQIMADGGSVMLSATTVQRLVDNLINVGGSIRATSFESSPGRISLLGDGQTRLSLSGTLDASGAVGGAVAVTARDVAVAGTARLLATGEQGGGQILVGGGVRGQGELPRASSVQVAAGALLDASAGAAGQGGEVVVWSDGATRFAGTVRASGGAAGGDGGLVEVSGKQLGFSGEVNASASRGRSGTLLLDPTDIVIDATQGDENLGGASGSGAFSVKADAINRVLVGGTSVALEASNDITLNAGAVIDGRALSGGTAGGGLSLTAARDIALNGNVILNAGNFTAVAGRSFTQATGVALASAGAGGAIAITAGSGNLTATNLLTAGAVSLTSTGGSVTLTQALSGTAAGGRVASLTANGANGVTLQQGALIAGATTLASSAGAIDTTGGTLDSTGAVSLSGATGITTAAIVTPAAVSVTGTGAATAVTLGAVAGPPSGGTPTAAAALTIQANGAVTLGGAVLGTGGLSVSGATGGTSSAGAFTLQGAGIVSGGAVAVSTSGAITLTDGAAKPAGIQAASTGTAVALKSTAGNIVTLSAAGAAAGSGTGAVIATSGGVTLDAQSVTLGIGGVEAVGSIAMSGPAGITLGGSVHSTGSTIALTSAGTVTANATLQAGGAVTLVGNTGVSAQDIVSPGAVSATSSAGSVMLGKVAGAAGTNPTAATGLTVNAQQNVTLSGAVLGSGGLSLAGATAGSGAASFTLRDSSIVTTVPVRVTTTGTIALQGAAGIGIPGTAPSLIELTSSGGSITTETGAVLAAGPVTLSSSGSQAGGFGITIGSGGVQAIGALTLTAAGNIDTAAGTLGSGGFTGNAVAVTSSAGNVRLGDVSTCDASCLERATGSGRLEVTATLGDVTLSKALGGVDTGYNYATTIASPYDGYRIGNRPAVGAVSITAGQDVELNGLNLDGAAPGAASGDFGLDVAAARRLISNALVAVNRGDVRLALTGSTGGTRGIFLGNSIYSRGIDSATGKTGFAVTVAAGTASSIYLFDNTNPATDIAIVPDVGKFVSYGDVSVRAADGSGGWNFVTRGIAQITVSNNVANFGGIYSPLLSSALPKITVSANAVQGYSANTAGALRLGGLADAVTAGITAVTTEQARNNVSADAARPEIGTTDRLGSGIGLKIAGFYTAALRTFENDPDDVTIPFSDRASVKDITDSAYSTTTIGVGTGAPFVVRYITGDPLNDNPVFGAFDNQVTGVFITRKPSTASSPIENLSPLTGKPSMTRAEVDVSIFKPFYDALRADSGGPGNNSGRDVNFIYNLSGMVVSLGPLVTAAVANVSGAVYAYTEQLIYSGFTYLGPTGIPQGNLQQTAAAAAMGSALTAFGNVGGFGSNSGGATGSAGAPTAPGTVAVAAASGNGFGLPATTTPPAEPVSPPVSPPVLPPVDPLPPTPVDPPTTPTTPTTPVDPTSPTPGTIPGADNAPTQQAEATAAPAAAAKLSCEVVFGGNPAADADMGRNGPGSGAAQDLRRRRYLLARAADASRTAQGSVEAGSSSCGNGR